MIIITCKKDMQLKLISRTVQKYICYNEKYSIFERFFKNNYYNSDTSKGEKKFRYTWLTLSSKDYLLLIIIYFQLWVFEI